MAKPQIEAKHTVIIDTDLHIQDPHDIILSYFNTQTDSQFVLGPKKGFRMRLIGIFVALVFMKFFFEEMFTSIWMFLLILIISLALGFVFAEGVCFFVRIMQNAPKKDGIRGIAYQLIFITIIVVLLGIFI
jgi:hypothetical protein